MKKYAFLVGLVGMLCGAAIGIPIGWWMARPIYEDDFHARITESVRESQEFCKKMTDNYKKSDDACQKSSENFKKMFDEYQTMKMR